MVTFRYARLSAAVTAALLLLPALAMAADGEADKARKKAEEAKSEQPKSEAAQLSKVTVTARRREETLQDVPVAVTAFTEKALQDYNVEDLSELDALVPNLTIYAARGSSSTVTAYLRGVGQSDPLWGVDPGVGVYIDDVYIARPQGALLDVVDVDRIEVLRGPQGTLYGKNTTGGAIKYITKPLRPDFSASGTLTVGNYGELDGKASVNVPLGSDQVIARFSAASLNRDGFGENRVTKQDVSDKEILVARASVGFFPNEDLSFVLSGDWLDDQSGIRGSQRLDAFNRFDAAHTPPLNSRYDVLSGMPNINDTTMHGGSLTANYRINDSWGIKSVTAKRSSDTDTNIDFDNLQNKIADVRALYSDNQFSQELQLNYDNGSSLRGVMGAYYFRGDAGGTVFNNFFNLSFGTTHGKVDTDSIAFYGEGTWQATDKLSFTAGLRYTDEKKTADVLNQVYPNATFTNPIRATANFKDDVSFNNVSPKISVDYKTDSGALVYGLVSRGFKSGGFNIRANVAAVPRSANPFGDESVTSFEVGTKQALYDDRFFFNAAFFHNRYRDIQLSVFTSFDSNGDGVNDSFFGDFTNAGKAHIQGVEFEVSGQITDRFSVQGNLAFLDAEYDEFIDRGVNVAKLQKFTNAPNISGALSAQYVLPLFGGELAARATASHQGRVIPTTDLSPVIAQEAYTLFNAGLIWRKPDQPWTVSLQGTNLSDKAYRTTGYNIPVLGVLTGFYGPPRQYTLAVTYDFH